jgi:hypothetical protein
MPARVLSGQKPGQLLLFAVNVDIDAVALLIAGLVSAIVFFFGQREASTLYCSPLWSKQHTDLWLSESTCS